jgi:hypothetical protein
LGNFAAFFLQSWLRKSWRRKPLHLRPLRQVLSILSDRDKVSFSSFKMIDSRPETPRSSHVSAAIGFQIALLFRSLVSTLVFPGLRNGKIEGGVVQLTDRLLQYSAIGIGIKSRTRIRLKKVNLGKGSFSRQGLWNILPSLIDNKGSCTEHIIKASTRVLYQHTVRSAVAQLKPLRSKSTLF